MGLYDREYYRDERQGFSLTGSRSMVANLILINLAVYVAELVMPPSFTELLSVHGNLLTHPWNAWQLVTAGFTHDPDSIWHIGINMFTLWFFGRDVEGLYGRKEFLRVYLCLIVLSSLAWVVSQAAFAGGTGELMGASGGVMGIIVLFVMNFPRRVIYIWGVLPVPAWVVGLIYVAQDLSGLNSGGAHGDGPRVAYEAHLAGALFGFLYYQSGLNLGRFLPAGFSLPGLRSRPRLRVHEPQSDVPESLDKRVDAVLDKVNRAGIDSLTPEERKLLEDASRRYQRRRS